MMIAGTERRRQGCSLQDGKQWGKMIAEYTTVNFPIPFNTVFGIFGERVYAGDNTADISVEKFNATSFTCNMNAYGTWFWSALGF